MLLLIKHLFLLFFCFLLISIVLVIIMVDDACHGVCNFLSFSLIIRY